MNPNPAPAPSPATGGEGGGTGGIPRQRSAAAPGRGAGANRTGLSPEDEQALQAMGTVRAPAASPEEEARMVARAARAAGVHARQVRNDMRAAHTYLEEINNVLTIWDNDAAAQHDKDEAADELKSHSAEIKRLVMAVKDARTAWEAAIYDCREEHVEEATKLRIIGHLYRGFDEDFCSKWTEAERIIEQAHRRREDERRIAISAAGAARKSHLPKIELDVFKGSFEEYIEWKERFDAIVMNDPGLEDFKKLHYLRQYTAGEAEKALQGVGNAGTDLPEAIRILEERFKNEQYLKAKYIDDLSHLPKASVMDLQRHYDRVVYKFNKLASVVPSIAIANEAIKPLIIGSFPPPTRREVEKELGDTYTLAQFFTEVEGIIKREERIKSYDVRGQKGAGGSSTSSTKGGSVGKKSYGGGSSSRARGGSNTSGSNKRGRSGGSGGGTTAGMAVGIAMASGPQRRPRGKGVPRTQGGKTGGSKGKAKAKCLYCHKDGHWLSFCQEFQKLAVKAREEFAQKQKLCFRCLRTGHGAKACPNTRPCSATENGQKCGKQTHHRLLHRASQKKA